MKDAIARFRKLLYDSGVSFLAGAVGIITGVRYRDGIESFVGTYDPSWYTDYSAFVFAGLGVFGLQIYILYRWSAYGYSIAVFTLFAVVYALMNPLVEINFLSSVPVRFQFLLFCALMAQSTAILVVLFATIVGLNVQDHQN